MGLKKYEIITVGSGKRVRALRSWQVGDRYVNIGDVGGIVYDEKTLSQDGACWLFSGNFGFPGARIGGDSIVDVGEAAIDAAGSANIDILGSSVVVGAKVNFTVGAGAIDGLILQASYFEQGGFNALIPGNPLTGSSSANYIRLKKPIFTGGKPLTLKCAVPGYIVIAVAVDRDGIIITNAPSTPTGADVTVTVPAGQYFSLMMSKDPVAAITPADGQTAQITFTALFDTKLVVVDSRLEINPVTSTGTVSIRSGGLHTIEPGAAYPDSVIRNSKVVINGHATANRMIRFISEFIGCNVAIDATAGDSQGVGIYSSVSNLTFTGQAISNPDEAAHSLIQAYNCDNFVVSPTTFPGLAAAQTANMPFIFQGCNVPDGRFYHHAQIANTYKNIDFALAQADLGKQIANPNILVSSEVEGMYRLYSTGGNAFGALIESYESFKSASLSGIADSYATTIYKDAYFNGKFAFAGTNVFGNTKKHDTSNTQDVSGVLVKGLFNATTNGSTISGVVANNARAVVSQPFRVSGAGGVSVSSPAGVECNIYLTDASNKILVNTGYVSGTNAPITPAIPAVYAYVAMRKTDGSDILSMDEFKGVTVTVYNGCKIVNTGETAVNMKGNIRVEDNATLVNASITGSGYFGGNAVMSGVNVNGYAYMKDNTLCTKTSENVQTFTSLIMEGNAVYNSIASLALNNLKLSMYDNSKVLGEFRNASVSVTMRDNATITVAGSLSGASTGTVTVQNDAVINTPITVVGDVTLRGSYVSTSGKTWAGKRVIDKHNAPEYDNNVKTQYDF